LGINVLFLDVFDSCMPHHFVSWLTSYGILTYLLGCLVCVKFFFLGHGRQCKKFINYFQQMFWDSLCYVYILKLYNSGGFIWWQLYWTLPIFWAVFLSRSWYFFHLQMIGCHYTDMCLVSVV